MTSAEDLTVTWECTTFMIEHATFRHDPAGVLVYFDTNVLLAFRGLATAPTERAPRQLEGMLKWCDRRRILMSSQLLLAQSVFWYSEHWTTRRAGWKRINQLGPRYRPVECILATDRFRCSARARELPKKHSEFAPGARSPRFVSRMSRPALRNTLKWRFPSKKNATQFTPGCGHLGRP